jgi:hypothetical protein
MRITVENNNVAISGEYYSIDPPPTPFEYHKIRHMVWLGTMQNIEDFNSGNFYLKLSHAQSIWNDLD